MRPIIIGVAGGTGSGKTTVVRKLIREIGADAVTLLQHDSYYKDQSHLSFEKRCRLNYDHPDSLESSLLIEHLKELLDGRSVEVPIYDFAAHARKKETIAAQPERVIIVDGILILCDPDLRELMDLRLYVDTDDDVRFIRRLKRDMEKRGRSLQSVIQQYLRTVKPMHREFVEPSKRFADLIIPEGGANRVAIDVLLAKIRSLVDGTSTLSPRADWVT
ncbi:MAG TPA: uridine kinase [Acidobacteriota bacterium]|nr:uridine kinase [Acidobacteriota bacterium]